MDIDVAAQFAVGGSEDAGAGAQSGTSAGAGAKTGLLLMPLSQGTWSWHGLFTVNEAGVLTRWDVTIPGASGAECHAYMFVIGNGTADVRHP